MKNLFLSCSLVLLALPALADTQKTPSASVTSVSGKCEAEIYAKAEAHIKANDENEFQGISEILELEPNEFTVTYGFNDECVGGVNVKIKPLKVIQKLNGLNKAYFEATECKVLKIEDGGADCG